MRIQTTYEHIENSTTSRGPARAENSNACADQPASRLETIWAWASLLVLIICWDAALRLDRSVPVPRVRIAHAVEPERLAHTRVSTEP